MRIYISCPLSVSEATLEAVAEKAGNNGEYNVRYWDRRGKGYNEKLLEDADLILFILPGNSFGLPFQALPVGLQSELIKAHVLQKPLAVAYRNTSGEMNIYKAIYDGNVKGEIRAVPGSTNYHHFISGMLNSIGAQYTPQPKKPSVQFASTSLGKGKEYPKTIKEVEEMWFINDDGDDDYVTPPSNNTILLMLR